jgi:hypothetical protein
MNASQLTGQIRLSAKHIRDARMWRDQLSLGLVVVALSLNAVGLVDLALKLHPLAYQIPVHYSSISGFSGFDRLGNWYEPYYIVLFGTVITLVNAYLAGRSFSRSRVASFYLLLGSVVVSIFCLIIANAFSSVS